MITRKFVASLIQFDCPNDKAMAIALIEQEIAKGAAAEPDLILLGETPYSPYTTVKDFAPLAEEIPGAYSETLCALAKTHGIHLCSGIVERDGNAIYNTALLISPAGRILYKHRKINVTECDTEGGFSRGAGPGIVETELGRIGVLICLDTASLDLISVQASLKPDIVLVPAYGLAKYEYNVARKIDCMVDECIDEWRVRMQTLAKCCRSYVLRADHCGLEGPQVRVGHSIAVSPGGYVIAEATMRPSILRVELDPSSPCQRSW